MGDDAAKRHRHIPPTDDSLLHGQPLPFLPDEVIVQILPWLPVRSLLQFKRVCKSWKTIISDPQFANIHLRNLNLNPSMTHQRLFSSKTNNHAQSCKIISLPMKPLFENPSEPVEPVEFNMEHKFSILGSCNGLLCLYDRDQGYVKLWNPSIGKSRNSPTLNCFDEGSFIKYYGFGYDHVNDKYKVLLYGFFLDEYATHIYTFGENSWATIEDFSGYYICTKTEGKFVSGTLNWCALKMGVDFTSNQSVILSFDLEKETYKELLFPDDDNVKNTNHVLCVLSNCLCVGFNCNKRNWNLWMMKKYGVVESWTRLTMIPYQQLRNDVQHQLNFYFIKPLFLLENGIVLLNINTKIVLLNLNNGRLEECLLGSRSLHIGFQQDIYYESLVSPQF